MYKIRTISLSLLLAITFVACGDSNNPLKQTPDIEISSVQDKAAADKAAVANERTVFATGETRSYIASDDGANKRGLSHSYSKSSGIVTDNITHLEWQDNTTSKKETWNDAVSYCQALTINGLSNWRLPSMKELQSLLDLGSEPHIDATFSTAKGGKYWSSTEYPHQPSNAAYYIDFSRGFSADYGDRSVYEKSNDYAVRCVRGDKLKEGSFSRNSSKETVMDSTTNLMWEDTSHIERTSGVEDAISYCENLTLGGFSDWKLPNINEYYTIVDRTLYDSAINPAFEHTLSIGTSNDGDHYRGANYWTSTYYGPHSELAHVQYYRTFNERDGASHRCRYYMSMHTRCVRKVK